MRAEIQSKEAAPSESSYEVWLDAGGVGDRNPSGSGTDRYVGRNGYHVSPADE